MVVGKLDVVGVVVAGVVQEAVDGVEGHPGAVAAHGLLELHPVGPQDAWKACRGRFLRRFRSGPTGS